MKINLKKALFGTLAVLFWIAVWHFAAIRVGKSILLPTPLETVKVFFSLIVTGEFWLTALTSLKSVFTGALAGVVLGLIVALLSYISPVLKYLFAPLLSLVKATPVASFIILALVWLGKDIIPFVIALMMVVPIVSANLYEGLVNVDAQLYEVTKLYKFSFRKKWEMLLKPSLLPYFLSAVKSGIALSWKAGIAAEVLCTPENSIGKYLHESRLYLEFPTLFAWTLTVIILSFFFEKFVVLIIEKLLGRGRRKA